jgi:outer membrane protein assembly factor BamB
MDMATAPEQLWYFDAPGSGWISLPTVVDDTVYFVSELGLDEDVKISLHALDATTGKEDWNWSYTSFSPYSPRREQIVPTLEGDIIHFGSRCDGHIYAISVVDKEERWRFKTDASTVKSNSTNNIVYACSNTFSRDELYAVDSDTGRGEWSLEAITRELPAAPPTTTQQLLMIDDLVYFRGTHDDPFILHAVDANVGEIRWHTRESGDFTAYDGTIYTSTGKAIDARTGTEQWKKDIHGSPTATDGTVYMGGHKVVSAVDANTGNTEWQTNIPASASTPTVAGDTVYVSVGEELYAFDIDTGDVKWRALIDSDTGSLGSPIVVDGTAYISSSDGIHAIETGETASSRDSQVLLGASGHHDLRVTTDPADVSLSDRGDTELYDRDRNKTGDTKVYRGGDTCHSCGKDPYELVDRDASFCPYCGAELG